MDDIAQERLDADTMPSPSANDYSFTQPFGDDWYERGESAVLWVPSVVSPYERNVLFNQRHQDFSRLLARDPVRRIVIHGYGQHVKADVRRL